MTQQYDSGGFNEKIGNFEKFLVKKIPCEFLKSNPSAS